MPDNLQSMSESVRRGLKFNETGGAGRASLSTPPRKHGSVLAHVAPVTYFQPPAASSLGHARFPGAVSDATDTSPGSRLDGTRSRCSQV